jgi:hypothetical protein
MTSDLKSDEPEFTYKNGSTKSTKESVISVLTGSGTTNTTLYLAAWMTKTQECWAARDTETSGGTAAGVSYAKVTTVAATCKATKAKKLSAAKWGTAWPTPTPGH